MTCNVLCQYLKWGDVPLIRRHLALCWCLGALDDDHQVQMSQCGDLIFSIGTARRSRLALYLEFEHL